MRWGQYYTCIYFRNSRPSQSQQEVKFPYTANTSRHLLSTGRRLRLPPRADTGRCWWLSRCRPRRHRGPFRCQMRHCRFGGRTGCGSGYPSVSDSGNVHVESVRRAVGWDKQPLKFISQPDLASAALQDLHHIFIISI